MDTNQYLAMFMEESKEHLQAINTSLLEMENRPDDLIPVQEVFRSAHTLKGMSASMGFDDLASLTHEMENVLDMVRNGQIGIHQGLMDVIFESVDALEQMVRSIERGGDGKLNVQPIVTKLQALVHTNPSSLSEEGYTNNKNRSLDDYQATVIEQSLEAGFSAYEMTITIEKSCVLKAARAFMVVSRLEENGEIVKTVPSIEDIEQERFEDSFSLIFLSKASKSEAEKWAWSVSEVADVSARALTMSDIKSMLALDSQTDGSRQEVAASLSLAASSPAEKGPVGQANKPVSGKTIRVDIDRLDNLMNLFSELVIDKGRLEQLSREIGNSGLTETTELLVRISGHMQDLMLKLRMVSIDQVFNRFPRMIRDLARDLNKQVNLVVSGSETELDRTVMDEIGDPLVHLLRNAVDHGLESTEERIAQGKPVTGTIALKAYHSGNKVFIEIQDDGKGIDRKKVLDKAVERGVLTSEQATGLTDPQVYQLLFASGFSTAETISDISGRGVGLDVVKSKIEALGGTVTVDSKPGQGTTFYVQLPLTLSIISAMLITLGNEKYAVPLSNVVETAIISKKSMIEVHGQKVLHFRDKVVPVVPLNEWFSIPASDRASGDKADIMIVQKGSKWGAILVDSLIGQQEIVIKPLGPYFGSINGISGATILGDGRIALIIDTNALIK